MSKIVLIYTDGSCSRNGTKEAIGGLGIHFPNGDLKDVSKIYTKKNCTNQRTELYAILYAIKYVGKHMDLSDRTLMIYTDSKYSHDSLSKWVKKWVKNGWMTQSKTPVANKDFIKRIYKYTQLYDIRFYHVFAHTGKSDDDSIANAVADSLARRATDKVIRKQRTKPKKRSKTKSKSEPESEPESESKPKHRSKKQSYKDLEVELVGAESE